MKFTNYKVITTIEELPEFNPELPVFSDLESDGLYINTRLIQYYQPETSEYVYVLDVDYFGKHTSAAKTQNAIFKALGRKQTIRIVPEQIKELHSKLWLVWWNGSYDQGTLRFGSKKVDDLWYMAKIALPSAPEYNLDKITKYLFPKENFYEGLDKKKLQKAKFKPGPLSDDQLRYSATDVYVMKFIWDKIYHKVKNNRAYQIDAYNLGYTVGWQQTGLKVNEPVRAAEEKYYKQKLEETHKQFPVDVNVNSYQQVRALLAAHDNNWDLSDFHSIIQKHKSNPIITESDETALLTRAANGCPYSKLILDERGHIKTIGFLESYRRDRVYSHYNPYGTRTGRWAAKGGDREDAANLQQLPRKLKKIFGFSDDDERVFVGADLPTAELRLIGAIYGEQTMADCFRNDIDIHFRTASNTLGRPIDTITEEDRKKAKAENFGLCYGMGPGTFQSYAFKNYGIVMTMDEAVDRRNKWMAAYPDQAQFLEDIKKRFFAGDLIVKTLMNRYVKPDMYTDASNIPIQGGIAEVAKIWFHYLYQEADKLYGIKHIPVGNFVHDSLTIEAANRAEAKDWEYMLYKSCGRAWDYYMSLPGIKIKDIPMPLKVGIGKGYGDAS